MPGDSTRSTRPAARTTGSGRSRAGAPRARQTACRRSEAGAGWTDGQADNAAERSDVHQLRVLVAGGGRTDGQTDNAAERWALHQLLVKEAGGQTDRQRRGEMDSTTNSGHGGRRRVDRQTDNSAGRWALHQLLVTETRGGGGGADTQTTSRRDGMCTNSGSRRSVIQTGVSFTVRSRGVPGIG